MVLLFCYFWYLCFWWCGCLGEWVCYSVCGLEGSAQQRQVILNVGVLVRDLGIGAVLDHLRHGALDGLAQLCVIGAELKEDGLAELVGV